MITLLLLVRASYTWVLFFAHIPFVVNRTFNATPTETLPQLTVLITSVSTAGLICKDLSLFKLYAMPRTSVPRAFCRFSHAFCELEQGVQGVVPADNSLGMFRFPRNKRDAEAIITR